MITKTLKVIYMACIVFVLDSADLDINRVRTMLKVLANCNNPDSSILVSILSAWQPVIVLMCFLFVPCVQTQTYVVEMRQGGDTCAKGTVLQ